MSNNDRILPQGPGETRDCLKAISAAISANIGPNETVYLASVPMSRSDLQTKVDGAIAIYDQVASAEAAVHPLVEQRDAAAPGVSQMLGSLLKYLENRFGDTSPVLASFGFRPRKKVVLTVDQKAAKVQKMRQTRQKNHTMGSQQKKALDEGSSTPPPASTKGSQP